MIKLIKLFVVLNFALVGCATSTQTANVVNTAGDIGAIASVVSGNGPAGGVYLSERISHQVHVSGGVICGQEMFFNFKNLQILMFD